MVLDVGIYANKKFPKQRIAGELADKSKPYWWNQGFFDYQFLLMLDEFRQGVVDLVELSQSTHVGIMCCEVLWWKCHRSMISDYLAWLGAESFHLQPQFKCHTDVLGNRLQRYHPDVLDVWKSGAWIRQDGI